MENEVRNKVITNLYKQAHKYYSSNIILEEALVDSLISGNITIKNTSQRNIEIIKKRLGIYDNGRIIPLKELGYINEKISYQRICDVIKRIISRLYNEDAEIKAEKIRNNKMLKQQFIENDIDHLELENDTTKILKEKGYTKIKDITELTEEELKSIFEFEKLDYKEIIERLKLFGLDPKKETYIDSIKEEDMSKETYEYLRSKSILSYEQLNDNITRIINCSSIKPEIRTEIIEIYNNHRSQKGKYLELMKKKDYIENRIKNLEENKKQLENELEKVIRKDIEIRYKKMLMNSIAEKQKLINDFIEDHKQQINEINKQMHEAITSCLSNTLLKKI